jgi:HSP20 family protein
MTLMKSTGFPSLFDDILSRDLFNWGNNHYSATRTTVPSVNIRETKDSFEVEMAAPGMEKKDFAITLDGTLLTISSQKQKEENNGNEGYSRREFSYESFSRSFQLSKEVIKAEEIKARYENGLLLLTIPKHEHAIEKGPRLIEIA